MTKERKDESEKFIVNKNLQYVIVPTSEKGLLPRKESYANVVDDHQQPSKSNKRAIFHQIVVACAVLLLSAACGMPIGYSAVLLPQLYNTTTSTIPIDISQGSWIASVHSLATPVGAVMSGSCADMFGRRKTLLFSVIPIISGWCLIALSNSYYMILAGRFITGSAVGVLGAPAMIYIAETAEPNLRSLLIGAPAFSYTNGILLIYILGSNLEWRLVAWLSLVLPIIAAVSLFLIPETPSWLVRNNRSERALKALKFLRNNESHAQDELKTIQQRLDQEKVTTKTNENIFRLCCQRAAYKPLLIVIVFSILQMFSGTFIVVFYAIDIISEFGGNIEPKSAAILTSIVRCLCTLAICFILLVVRRRLLTTISAVGSGVSCLALSVFMYCRQGQPKSELDVYVAITCLTSYIAFNTPLMVMPGIMVGELFPAKIRGRTAGTMFACCNVALFCLAKAFPLIKEAVKTRGIFLMFATASFLAAIFTYLLQPETKGRTLDEIEDYFNEKNWCWFNRSDRFRTSKKTATKTSNL